jgi:hypothetical protein
VRASALGLAVLLAPSVAAADEYDWEIEAKTEPRPLEPTPRLAPERPRRERVSIEIDAPAGVKSELRRGKRTVASCDGRCSVIVPSGDYVLHVDGLGISHARHRTRADDDLRVNVTPGSPVEKTIGRATWIVGGAVTLAGLTIAALSGWCGEESPCDPKLQRRAEIVGGVVGGVGLALLAAGLVLDFDGRTGIDVTAARREGAGGWHPKLACAPTKGGAFGSLTFGF